MLFEHLHNTCFYISRPFWLKSKMAQKPSRRISKLAVGWFLVLVLSLDFALSWKTFLGHSFLGRPWTFLGRPRSGGSGQENFGMTWIQRHFLDDLVTWGLSIRCCCRMADADDTEGPRCLVKTEMASWGRRCILHCVSPPFAKASLIPSPVGPVAPLAVNPRC